MKRIAAVIMIVCMAVTGVSTGAFERAVSGDDLAASAASYPALKTITYKATGNQKKDIIGFALTQVGYKEGSGNNTYFGNWFGFNYNPWCAMFVCWSARKAGVTKSVIPSLATADRSWAKNQGIYHKSKQWGGSYTPKKGDLIYFSWSVRDWADHIGMVTGTHKDGSTTYVDTVEGNKHDKVVQASYALSNKYILGYASPKYVTSATTETTEAATSKTTYTLKYRDGLDSTSNDEEDAIIPPVTGTFGQDLTLSTTKFTRTGYSYTQWDVYRENSSGKLIYLCRSSDGKTEKWYEKASIPSGYTQVTVKAGAALNIATAVTGTVYVSPVWKKKTYAITYDANGGTGAPASQKKTYGKSLTITTDKPTRSGYSFLGWATSATATAAEYKSGASYTKNAKLTLYAVWGEETFKVKTTAKVNARKGAGTKYEIVKTIASGETVTIKKVSGNWGQMSDGNWIALKYTLRQGVTEYQLEYSDGVDATTNDSQLIASVTVKYGSAVKTSAVKFVRTGYSYEKWQLYYLRNGNKMYLCKEKNGSTQKWYAKDKIPSTYAKVKVKPGSSVTVKTKAGDRIYIAPAWTRNTYKIQYKANGGKKAPKAQTKTYGKTLTLRKGKPTRSGYAFSGWATTSTATSAKYQAGAAYTDERPAVLYAVWKATTYKVKTTDSVNKRKGPGSSYAVTGSIAKGKTVTIVKKKNGWGKLKGGDWIYLKYTKKVSTKTSASATAGGNFKVKVTATEGVTARSGAGSSYGKKASYARGKTLTVTKVSKGWGKLKEGGWIPLKYTKITSGYKVKITSKITQRAGPGKTYESRGKLSKGTYEIAKISGSWAKVKSIGYWVKLSSTKRVK